MDDNPDRWFDVRVAGLVVSSNAPLQRTALPVGTETLLLLFLSIMMRPASPGTNRPIRFRQQLVLSAAIIYFAVVDYGVPILTGEKDNQKFTCLTRRC